MYFAALATETQIDRGDHIRAIGWLTRDRAFTSGNVPSDFARRLRMLCDSWALSSEALWWPVAGGGHECEFCGDYSSGGNLGVPAGQLRFVAPQMVSHYVDDHSYQPPDPFVRAVLTCPDFGTEAFKLTVAGFREINLARARARGLL
jgi:hypothetical protein